jgi:hypothetical protein
MIRNRFAVFAAALTLAVGLSARPALAQTWTFEDFAQPPASPLSQTKGGISAYFGDDVGIVNLDTLSNPFYTLTGHVLQTGEQSPVIFIGLSQAVTSMTFNWAMIAPERASTLMLLTFLGGRTFENVVSQNLFSGSSVYAGVGISGLGISLTEGFASYSGSAFDGVVICASGGDFACDSYTTSVTVDNVSVSTVPEPSTYALMAAGLAALGIVSRRRRRALVA